MNFLKIITLIVLCIDGVFSFNPIRNWVANKFIPQNTHVEEWWYNPVIHSFGNIGIGGTIHATVAPFVTKLIDEKAYKGRDVRQEICDTLVNNIDQDTLFAMDFACGVGMSSNALYKSIENKNFEQTLVYALDTSPQMVRAAKNRGNSNINYRKSNVAINEFMMYNDRIDLVTCFFMFHEVPEDGHRRVFKNAHSLLRHGGIFAITDISADYKPSTGMLMGEPYMIEYQKTINDTIDDYVESGDFKVVKIPDVPNHPVSSHFQEWIPGHVMVTLLEKI